MSIRIVRISPDVAALETPTVPRMKIAEEVPTVPRMPCAEYFELFDDRANDDVE